jgi:hypothetical protein
MIVTGLTKLKLGDTFSNMKNLTLVTSNGLVYRWGMNILNKQAASPIFVNRGSEDYSSDYHSMMQTFNG